MNKSYVDQENMEEMGLKDKEAISKKNVIEGYDQNRYRNEEGASLNGNKERQENELKKYRDGTFVKYNREVQQQEGQKYEDGTSMKDEKEYQQKNRDYNPEYQDGIYVQKVRQEESPGNQGYRN